MSFCIGCKSAGSGNEVPGCRWTDVTRGKLCPDCVAIINRQSLALRSPSNTCWHRLADTAVLLTLVKRAPVLIVCKNIELTCLGVWRELGAIRKFLMRRPTKISRHRFNCEGL